MFNVITSAPEYIVQGSNTWTFDDFTAFVDSLPNNKMFWLYLTGPAMKTISDSRCSTPTYVLVFKKSETETGCFFFPSDGAFPEYTLRQYTGTWQTALTVRAAGT